MPSRLKQQVWIWFVFLAFIPLLTLLALEYVALFYPTAEFEFDVIAVFHDVLRVVYGFGLIVLSIAAWKRSQAFLMFVTMLGSAIFLLGAILIFSNLSTIQFTQFFYDHWIEFYGLFVPFALAMLAGEAITNEPRMRFQYFILLLAPLMTILTFVEGNSPVLDFLFITRHVWFVTSFALLFSHNALLAAIPIAMPKKDILLQYHIWGPDYLRTEFKANTESYYGKTGWMSARFWLVAMSAWLTVVILVTLTGGEIFGFFFALIPVIETIIAMTFLIPDLSKRTTVITITKKGIVQTPANFLVFIPQIEWSEVKSYTQLPEMNVIILKLKRLFFNRLTLVATAQTYGKVLKTIEKYCRNK